MTAATGAGGLAITVTVVATLVVLALLAAAGSLVRDGRELRRAAEELRRQGVEAGREIQGMQARAEAELRRVDDLVGSAEVIAETVSAASRLTHASLASPVIKVMALGAGARRAARRLRGGRSPQAVRARTARR